MHILKTEGIAMKLIHYELNKVLSQRTFMIVIAIMLIMNSFILYNKANENRDDYMVAYRDEYLETLGDYTELPLDEAREKLQSERTAYDIIATMKMLTEQGAEMEEMFTAQLEDYKKNTPQEYELAKQLAGGEKSEHRSVFINVIANRIKYIDDYAPFVDEMRSRADEQSKSAVYSDKSSFAYKNLYKTADDYEHMKGTTLAICNETPFQNTVDHRIGDLFIIAAAALSCVYLFAFEKSHGLMTLVYSTEKGRLPTAVSKLAALLVLVFASVALFTGSTLITNIICCGTFDPTVAVQSASVFRNCVIPVSLGGFIVLSVLAKTFGVMIMAALFAMLLILSAHQSLSYIIAAALCGAEFWLYQSIDESVAFNHPKFLNFFYILDTAQSLGVYRNLDIFGTPIMALPLVLLLSLFLLATLCAVSCVTFCYHYRESGASKAGEFFAKVRRKLSAIGGTTSIFLGELYKYLFQSKMALPLLLLLIFAVYSSVGTVRYPHENEWDGDYRAYMEIVQGEPNDETAAFMESERKYFESLQNRTVMNGASDNSTQMRNDSVEQTIKTKKRAFEEITQEYEHVLQMRSKGVDAKLIDRHVYGGFVYSADREWRYMLILFVLLVAMLTSVFSLEYKHDMVNILRPNRCGKGRLCADKFILLVLNAVLCTAAIFAPYTIRFVRTYSTEYISAPVSSLTDFSSAGSITIAQSIAITMALYLLSALMITAIAAAVSVTVRDGMLSVIVSAVLVLIPTAVIGAFPKLRFGAVYTTRPVIAIAVSAVIMIAATAAAVAFTTVRFANLKIGRHGK